jgi:hypothetical protein
MGDLLEIIGVLLKLFVFGVSVVTSGIVVYVLLQVWFGKSESENMPKHKRLRV